MGTTTPELEADIKRRKLEALLRKRALAPRDLPLSVGQERLYRLVQLSPDQPFYNVAVAYRLRGQLDASAVEKAVGRIAERHHVLRAAFPRIDGKVVQRIAPKPPSGLFAARFIDENAIETALAEEAAQKFNLENGPLWRVALLRIGEEAHVLTLVMHHIVTDGWSIELLLDELGALATAFSRGDPDPLDPSPVQYAAYADRQRAGFAEAGFALQKAYWEKRLAERIPALGLPADLGNAAQDDRRAASMPLTLPDGLGEELNALGNREGVSSFMTTLTAFSAMLNRWSGQTDMVVCTPVTGRHRAQSREVIGYCNNILPIRVDLSGDPTLGELLRRVRTVTLEAYKNQDVPFEEIADTPGLKRIPLSRLLFSLDMPWPPSMDIVGLECTPMRIETGAADFDLSVSLWPTDDRLDGALRYKKSLFSERRVEAIADAFRATLAALVDAPDSRLSDLVAVDTQTVGSIAPCPVVPETVSPRFPLEEKLARIWRAVFEQQEIGVFDDFRTIGASSLAVAVLAERLQNELGVAIELPVLFRAGTIARMCAYLEEEDSTLANDTVAPIRPNGSRPPLFLFEGVSVYYPLADHLPVEQPVYGLVRPVVSEFRGVEDMAASYVDAILEVCPSGPYHLGGLSFGGLVAFEAAQQLKAKGAEVGVLALFDTPGPNAGRPKPRLARALGHARNTWKFGIPYLRRKLARRFGVARVKVGTAQDSGGAAVAKLLDPLAQRRAFARYADRYEIGPFAGRIVFIGLSQRDGMMDSLFDPALDDFDPLLGWGDVAEGGVEAFFVEGDHTGMLKDPNVSAVAAHLNNYLAF